MADTMTIGSSSALAAELDELSGRFLGGGDEGGIGRSVSTKSCGEKQRIRCQTHKRFGINAGRHGYETQHAKGKFLAESNHRQRRVAWFE
jgi:hypothetical protein